MPFFNYDKNIPNPPNDPADDVDQMQINSTSISDLIDVDHWGFNDAAGGYHKKSTYPHMAAPAPVAGTGILFGKLIAGDTWPVWVNATGETTLMGGGSSIGTNGHVYLPGGIIMQWGTFLLGGAARPQPVNFPLVFPNNTFNVQVSITSTLANPAGNPTVTIFSGSVNTAGFSINSTAVTGLTTCIVYWVAIGN